MKRINNNGFTLVEVLAVVVILGILSFLVTTAIMGYFNRGKNDYDQKLRDQLVISAKDYYSDHQSEIRVSISDNHFAYVALPTMQSNNYITKDFVDSNGRECSSSFVYIKRNSNHSNQFDFIPCLICKDSDGSTVSVSGNDNQYCDSSNWNN